MAKKIETGTVNIPIEDYEGRYQVLIREVLRADPNFSISLIISNGRSTFG